MLAPQLCHPVCEETCLLETSSASKLTFPSRNVTAFSSNRNCLICKKWDQKIRQSLKALLWMPSQTSWKFHQWVHMAAESTIWQQQNNGDDYSFLSQAHNNVYDCGDWLGYTLLYKWKKHFRSTSTMSHAHAQLSKDYQSCESAAWL